MKDTIQPGLETEQHITVDADRVTRHIGGVPGVYATPMLLRDIERTCRELLQEHVDEGQDSVGTRVDLQHLAPTLEGAEVTIRARVSEVDRRAVTFDVTVSDAFEDLARASHSRFIVDKNKIRERLDAKAAKIKGG